MHTEDTPTLAELVGEERQAERDRVQESWYRTWCALRGLDPDAQASARLYEEATDADAMWSAYEDAKEDHR